MKNLKNTLKITSIFILLAATLSCSNIFSKNLSQSEPNKTILKVNVQDSSVERTVFPSNDVSILSDFTVTCERSGFTSKTKTAADSQALNALVFEFEDGEEGSWDISIEGSYKIGSGTSEQTLTFSDTKTVNVQKNMLNSVTFALKNSDYSYGGLNITVNFADTTAAVSTVFLALQTQIMSGQPLDQKEYTIFDTTANGKSFTYSRDISDALERLGEGTYNLNLVFLAEDNSLLNYLSIGVRIVNGLTTSKTLNIAVNQIYDAEYEFYAGGTKLNVAAGQTFPEGVEIDGTGVLPLRYSTQGIDLPGLKLQDYGFDGWYDDPTGGNLVTKLAGFPASGTSKKVYARFFKPELIVSSDSSVNPDYTTIDDALKYIRSFAQSHNSYTIDWVIKVRGTLSGCQTVDNMVIDSNASSITIEGYNTPEAGSDPSDTIDAVLSEPTKYGVALSVTASTPVILKNIKITGGNNDNSDSYTKGGGIYIGPGTDVTLGEGVLIIGNSAPEGSGIYATDDFTMGGSAFVASDNDIYLKKDSYGIKTITISNSLTKANTSNKIKITPGAYQNDAPLMYVDYNLSFTPAQTAAEFEKFEVTQPEGAAFTCRITSTGRLAKYDSSADGNYYADLGLPSGTLWSVKNWGESSSVPGKSSAWHNFSYGDPTNYSTSVWGDEWSIASNEEWQELIDNCYWKESGSLTMSSGNKYSVYYVYKAKNAGDKGKVDSYGTNNASATYDPEKDICIQITRTAYQQNVIYWPQTFVEAANENTGAANYTPKPTKIDMSGTAPVLTNTWTSASEQYQYYRLVISKKKTLVVTESGGSDTNSGRNAKDALTSIQGALDKIYATESSFENPSAIDWEILYYGEITTGQQFATYEELTLNSLTVYSITGTGSEATKSKWIFDSQGNLKLSTGGVPADFVLVTGASITEPPAQFSSGGQFTSASATTPITVPSFYMCVHEVTQEEYEEYCFYGDSSSPSETSSKNEYPVYYINWYDAIVYCNLRSIAEHLTPVYSIKKSGETEKSTIPAEWDGIRTSGSKYCGPDENKPAWDWVAASPGYESIDINPAATGYRLPTAIEWEYAARGGNGLTGDQTKYSGSSVITEVSYDDYDIHKIQLKNANTLGIYDMSGSVSEWLWDVAGEDFRTVSPLNDYIDSTSSAYPYERDRGSYNYIGFRVVRNAPENP